MGQQWQKQEPWEYMEGQNFERWAGCSYMEHSNKRRSKGETGTKQDKAGISRDLPRVLHSYSARLWWKIFTSQIPQIYSLSPRPMPNPLVTYHFLPTLLLKPPNSSSCTFSPLYNQIFTWKLKSFLNIQIQPPVMFL